MEGEEGSSVDTRGGGLSAKVNNAGSRAIGPSIFFARLFYRVREDWAGKLVPESPTLRDEPCFEVLDAPFFDLVNLSLISCVDMSDHGTLFTSSHA